MKRNPKAREKQPNANESPFLGILEGKRDAAKAAAAVKIEEAKQDTLTLKALAASKGYNPEGDTIKAEASNSKTTTYIVIGVVAILMIGLYFIIKIKKR